MRLSNIFFLILFFILCVYRTCGNGVWNRDNIYIYITYTLLVYSLVYLWYFTPPPSPLSKTETVKDLGRGLALPVYVFNCSSQMGVNSLGDIFRGLCQTGGWGYVDDGGMWYFWLFVYSLLFFGVFFECDNSCFDEFNRIPIEVLSVVSTQYLTILQGLRSKATKYVRMWHI